MPKGVAQRAEVVSTERLTPHMVRVVFSGPDGAPLATDPAGRTDAYVKVLLPQPGTGIEEPFDFDDVKERFERTEWPVKRTYTIRHFDPTSGRLTLDFVVHGDAGIAGPWADSARPGDQVQLLGPGGNYAPDPQADWHLLIGDESVLPAIATALEAMPEDATAHVFIEVAGHDEEQELTRPAGARVRWIHRDQATGAPGEDLVAAVKALDFPAGRVHAFLHGEAMTVKPLRSFLRFDKEIPREDLSVSGYWRRGNNDEQWRAGKKQWKAEVEAEETAHQPA